MKREELARYFDHTILKAFTVEADVRKVCEEAVTHGFYSVCVNPCHVALVAAELKGTGVRTCSVVGFPLGANVTGIKAPEAALAVEQGAREVDMVITVGKLKQGLISAVESDIRAVVEASGPVVVKVIIETCYLEDEEKVAACKAAENAGAHFVKTSTGFGTGGATVEDIALIRRTVGDRMKIKASGGIGTLKDALALIDAGADRLGASAGVSILSELKA
ncbi:MAG: deoxyribose-phosphate aldolase [Desulfobacteraceae bacterium]|nr:deoxyribose-phosphate aldolase [Desulfobacteraceae bacterium]